MKYIIDVDEDRLDNSGQLFIAVDIPNSQSAYEIPTGIWVKDYTEPDRKVIEDEVWEFAKKVRVEEFDSYSEAKAKHESWKKQRDEIRVGDEVIPFDTQYDKMVVTNSWTSEYYDEWVDTIAGDGEIHRFLKASVKKTGRHFDEVKELLKKIKEE